MVFYFSKLEKELYQIYKDSKENVYSFQNVLIDILRDYKALSAVGSTDVNFIWFPYVVFHIVYYLLYKEMICK